VHEKRRSKEVRVESVGRHDTTKFLSDSCCDTTCNDQVLSLTKIKGPVNYNFIFGLDIPDALVTASISRQQKCRVSIKFYIENGIYDFKYLYIGTYYLIILLLTLPWLHETWNAVTPRTAKMYVDWQAVIILT